MLKRKNGPNEKMAAEVLDSVGDHVTVRCFNCGGVFGVVSLPTGGSARSCPHCRQTAALNSYGDVTTWVNEDGRSKRWLMNER
jgi:hypothetical protein